MPNSRSVGNASSTETSAANTPPQMIASPVGSQVWCKSSQPEPYAPSA